MFNECNLASNENSLEQNSGISMSAPDDGKDENSSIVSLVFPNSEAQTNENNAAVLETAHFKVTFSLPDGWKLGGQANTENNGSDKTNIGIVSYNRDKQVYIAIELLSDMVSTEQAEYIAKSIDLTVN